jgi:hypothetical protein
LFDSYFAKEIVLYAGGKLIDFHTLKMPRARKYRLVITPSEEVNQGKNYKFLFIT